MRANAKRGENELSDLIAREVTDSCDGVLLCNKVQLLPIHRLEGGGGARRGPYKQFNCKECLE